MDISRQIWLFFQHIRHDPQRERQPPPLVLEFQKSRDVTFDVLRAWRTYNQPPDVVHDFPRVVGRLKVRHEYRFVQRLADAVDRHAFQEQESVPGAVEGVGGQEFNGVLACERSHEHRPDDALFNVERMWWDGIVRYFLTPASCRFRGFKQGFAWSRGSLRWPRARW